MALWEVKKLPDGKKGIKLVKKNRKPAKCKSIVFSLFLKNLNIWNTKNNTKHRYPIIPNSDNISKWVWWGWIDASKFWYSDFISTL